MSSDIVVQQEPQKETDLAIVPQFHAVAINATEMADAKQGIKTWLEAKVLSIESEVAQLQETLDAAIRHKWKSSGFKSQLQREKQKQMYYQKLLAAVHAGYTVIPNLPCDVFAIRVNRYSPAAKNKENTAITYKPSAPRIDDEQEQRLPVGEGRYESPIQTTDTNRWDTKNEKGEIVHHAEQYATGFAEMEFPLAIANPMVMDVTARAMSMKIFDRIGIVRDSTQVSGDPIVVGQITRKVGYSLKTATFLLAWYLDFRTL